MSKKIKLPKIPKRRDPMAFALTSPLFRNKITKDPSRYTRKIKHKNV